ncbi:MAG: hypothetical protein Q9218_005653 [Villophora microphyllina]
MSPAPPAASGIPDGPPLQARFISALCINIKPGHCCNALPTPAQTAGTEPYNKRIKYRNLAPQDIAVVWTNEGDPTGCNGRSIASFTGGGQWEYVVHALAGPIISGGNYIKLPQGMPPTGEESQWMQGEGMQGEGILGLATNYYGDWFSFA